MGGGPQPQFRKGQGGGPADAVQTESSPLCGGGAHQVSPYLQVEAMQIVHICSNFCPHNFSACEWSLPATVIAVLFSHDLQSPSLLLHLEEPGCFCKGEMHLLSRFTCFSSCLLTPARISDEPFTGGELSAVVWLKLLQLRTWGALPGWP